MSNINTRVVVTGMDIVCSAGSNITEFFQSLDRARSGISPLVDIPVCRGKALAAQIKSPSLNSPFQKQVDFDHLVKCYPAIRSFQHLNRTAVLGFAAAACALARHDIWAKTPIDEKLGLMFATAL